MIIGPSRKRGRGCPNEAVTLIEAFSTPPTALRAQQICAAISHLKDGPLSGNNVLAKLDMLQVYKAADSSTALIDWVDPSRTASAINAPTFTADEGFSTNGTNQEIDTNYNPGDGGSYNYLQNSASFGVWRTDAGQGGSIAGWMDGTDGTAVATRDASNNFTFRINQAQASPSSGTRVAASGVTIATDGSEDQTLDIAVRTGASATGYYRSGVPQTVSTNANQASTAVNNETFRVGRILTASYTAVDCSLAIAGSELTENEVQDITNALQIGYGRGVDNDMAIRAASETLHAVRNAWDNDGRHYVISGADELYRSDDNGSSYQLIYTFPDSPARSYGLFISSSGTVFVSTQDHSTGIDGRVYRSTDQGDTFTQIQTFDAGFHSGNIAFWPMVEDTNGDLYCGQYNVENPKVNECHVWKSTDDGVNWSDISDSSWSVMHHVHGLGIDPVNGWLYATIGDENVLSGVWRSKLKDGSDWVQKTPNDYQYIPIEFFGGQIYLGDDEQAGTISRFSDDGTATRATPTVVLTEGSQNCYYLKKDNNDLLWALFPPANDDDLNVPAGYMEVSTDGTTWIRVFRLLPMVYSSWNAGSSSSIWAMHTGTTQWGNRNISDNLFPSQTAAGISLKVIR